MGKLRIIDPVLGDEHITWDPNNAEEVQAAKDKFDSLTKAGHKVYKVTQSPSREGEAVSEFDANTGEYLVAPPMSGG